MEILVSAVVAGFLTTSVFYFLSAQNGLGAMANDQMKSVNLGRLKMDSLKVDTYDELVSGSDTVSERYIRSWHVTPMRNGAGLLNGRKKIALDVFWPLSGEQSVSLVSLRSDDKYKEGWP